MNAVTRTAFVVDNSFVKNVPFNLELAELKIVALISLLLISALSMVYIKDFNRRLFITYNKLQIKTEQLQTENNKLLLEQSAWGAQARVQVVAQRELQMQIPRSADVYMIKI